MDRAQCDRLAAWLERPDVQAVDPPGIAALRVALATADPPVAAGRAGTLVGYAPGPGRRRLVQFDRRGNLVAACRWTPSEDLEWASCRTAHGVWIGVEPGTVCEAPWGRSDRLWRLDGAAPWAPREALTVFQALDYRRLDFIPALFEPARLPAGAGTAVLNLIAGLMKDQGMARVRYRGPYPTEQLFTALLESFRFDGATDDPLGRFMAGGALDWLPAPHESHRVADGVFVQIRHGIDKVVLDDIAFYRRDWQGVVRREPRVVREDEERVICSLWAFGRSIEDRLILDGAGEVRERPAPIADSSEPAPLPPVWGPALGDIIARESAPALAEPLRQVLRELNLEWGPMPGDLVRVEGVTARVSRRLRDAGVTWVKEAAGQERGRRAIAFVLEVARLLAPAARRRAQARLAALTPEAQALALAANDAPSDELPTSVGRLLTLVVAGGA